MVFLKWFYKEAPLEIIQICRNFLKWGWNYFSIGYFLPRILSPWHHDITNYGPGFDLKRFLHVWGWNLISRLIGAVLRIVVMVAGVIAEIFIFAITAVVFIFWFVIPLAIPILIIIGLLTLIL